MSDDESGPFSIEPKTQADYVRANWQGLIALDTLIREEVIPRLDTTNGRVGSLEKWRYGIAGGIAVIAAVVVPLFIYAMVHVFA